MSTEHLETLTIPDEREIRPVRRRRRARMLHSHVEGQAQSFIRRRLNIDLKRSEAEPIGASELPGRFPGAQPYSGAICSIRRLRERQGSIHSLAEDGVSSR